MMNPTESALRKYLSESRELEAEKQAIREAGKNNDFERLNQFAARAVARGERPAGAVFKMAFDLLNGKLPLMDKPLSFDNRLELAFYLKLLKDEFERVRAGAPCEWQDRKFAEIRTKQIEIEGVLNGLVGEGSETKSDDNKKKERDLTKWLRETWESEGCPNGTAFFNALKKYDRQNCSPIRQHYTTGPNGAGIRWSTGSASGEMTKKAIQNKASAFKNERKQNTVNS